MVNRYRLTSEEAARAMAEGALHASDANLGIASTGIAGPSNGDGEEAVGTVCMAWSFRYADRNAVRDAATAYALQRVPVYHRTFIDSDGRQV